MSNQDKRQTLVIAFAQWRNTRTHRAARTPQALRQQNSSLTWSMWASENVIFLMLVVMSANSKDINIIIIIIKFIN